MSVADGDDDEAFFLALDAAEAAALDSSSKRRRLSTTSSPTPATPSAASEGSYLASPLPIDFLHAGPSHAVSKQARGHIIQSQKEREEAQQLASMENRKEEQQAVGWMTVPAFGEWDVKNGAVPDYSMDFSKIREMRKQNKRELSRASLGGDEDLLQAQAQQGKAQAAAQQQQPDKASAAVAADDDHRRPLHGDSSPTGRKKFLSYFQCCIRA